ncbi:MAG: flavodoxin domain-containing protein [Aminobacterium sp.]|uniref:FprA family A-type flavoprotein n=1 Tax=Aminobacterium sp. TaxID=1872491 RepID=UPI002B20AF0C|nr:flavodoxin domain-containing protein [Aminobacterium sp.]MEA4878458.1 flavodoxin domain-containing protein [Aminobacterium sp.]
MTPLEIKPGIFWAGVLDWTLRDFHGYSTEKGSTYNAYIVKGRDKIALFDTVKTTHFDEFIERLEEIVDVEKIDYIVVNHAEMDHSGSLPMVVDRVKPEKIFLSKPCKDALIAHFGDVVESWPLQIVATGDEVSLGGKTISFIEARMLHWPDSMFSYIKEDRVLISNDGFGQHYSTSVRFDDEADWGELMHQSAKYYANILLPYSPIMLKKLDEIGSMNIEIDMIAPDHGIIWRSHIPGILSAYRKWAEGKCLDKAVVTYDTMWHSTENMARHIAEGLINKGIETHVMDLRVTHHSDVMTEILDARGLLLGSPTLNTGYLPRMADLVCYVKGLRPIKKVGAAFGSYGWAGESLKLLNQELEAMKINIVHPGIKVKYVPRESDLHECFAMGESVAEAIYEANKA